MYIVILAGGGGTRLWPLSTPARPKPFIPLLGERTLFQRTVDRLLEGDQLEVTPADILVVTDRRYAAFVRAQAPAGVTVVEEPMGRNTAAAIALATVVVDRPDDEVMAVLPADHTIAREDVFRGVVRDAGRELALGAFGIESPLVTLGIEVSRPATEYGYLIADVDRGTSQALTAYPLLRFEEKPNAERAAALERSPGVAWNAGMFLWRRRAIRAALQEFAPDILASVATAHRSGTLADAYVAIRSSSIDYAVMEPAAEAGRVVMGAMEVGWTDLGSWGVLLSELGVDASGRVVQAGEPAEATADDLIVRRREGRLVLDRGPASGILDADGPSALLVGAAFARGKVLDLIMRVSAEETRS
jgi:mannose-1-phosphate guanylyltransferase/mannose-1-phosphate guanylyltransferase/mannose-6-phosphate isomerase